VHSYDTSLLGWIVLVPRRHIESIDELTDSEGHELGDLLRTVSSFLKRRLGCTKTYVMQFAEHPLHPHVHFHVVPRMPDIPQENIGANVFNYLGVDAAVRISEDDMDRLAAQLRDELSGTAQS
jgi:diadenosine tetraphosphate (Ap4A) HIT family hydrolase